MMGRLLGTPRRPADLSVFHEFAPPPTGGGHQFMRALWSEFERRGLQVEGNRLSRGTPVCMLNSFQFNYRRLRRAVRRSGCRVVHRVDGPLAVYRGFDDGTDARIHAMNAELADATVFQSRFSKAMHAKLGMPHRDPVVIMNAADPTTFHTRGREPLRGDRPVRIISTSWSDNPNKGLAVYQWLDANLDWTRFEYRFLGRVQSDFANIEQLGALPSEDVADALHQSDIYITASREDPCSNSLIEALACGLPCLYLNSGGHPEIAGTAGLPFEAPEEIPGLLDQLVEQYDTYRAAISIPTIAEVADQYLDVLMAGR